ncbi:MAG: flavodoxin family protein [Verrucomicrobia bacterium]|nr:flavodoxin family protein [Verrucomicrobiota bacterium]MBU4285460.1 flavodoxin family protein [Verrucomicrobiota bacterium]
MKILAICGSPRGKKSQTKVLAGEVLKAAQAQGADVDMADLSEARIEFCRACEACHQKPGCVLHDDANTILANVLNADGLVLASPVYLNQVTAQLKAVLDRSSHFVHCMRLIGKYLAVVTTSGGGGGAQVQAYLRNYGNTVGAQCVGGVDAKSPLKPADVAAAAALGKALVAAIQEKQQYPDQIKSMELQKQYFRKLITLRKDDWPYEYQFWRNQDGL